MKEANYKENKKDENKEFNRKTLNRPEKSNETIKKSKEWLK